MIIKQISIFIENRKGRLAEVTDIIAKNGINIRALSIADTMHFGVLRIVVDDPYETEKILKANNLTVSVTAVISVSVPDKPGGLAEVLDILYENDIQVEYMYAFISKDEDKAYMIMRVEEELKAQEVLKGHGYTGLANVIG